MNRHPFRHGLLLALLLSVMVTLRGAFDDAALFLGQEPMLLLFGAGVAGGAFLAALPGRVRRRRQTRQPVRVRRCALAFGGGAAMLLGARLAGAGGLAMTAGAMQGGLGALAFLVVAGAAALLTARLSGRWSA